MQNAVAATLNEGNKVASSAKSDAAIRDAVSVPEPNHLATDPLLADESQCDMLPATKRSIYPILSGAETKSASITAEFPFTLSVDEAIGDQRLDDEIEEVIPDDIAHKLYYGVEDSPPISSSLLFGFQQVMVCAAGVIAMPLLVSEFVCAQYNLLARVKLIGTMLFITGFSTILQTTWGARLPLIQGPSAAFIPPIMVLMRLPQFRCPDVKALYGFNQSSSFTEYLSTNLTAQAENDEMWMSRITLIQGGLATAAVVQMLVGLTGAIGLLTRYIGPLTIAPLMLCLEISLVGVVVNYCQKHWMSVVTLGLILLMAFYISSVKVPLPAYDFVRKKFYLNKFPIFMLFPYMLALATTWILCWILTSAGVFSSQKDYSARTDTFSGIIQDAPWFRFPYPCQWGMPTVSLAAFGGMVAGTLGSIIESVGDYHACARVTIQPPPPPHAVNRGIFIEGVCCLVGSFLGGGASVTTYSENVGVIGITKVGSRRTMQLAGVIFMFLGLFTKFGAVLATIPDPLVGGILCSSLSMVGGVGLSSIQLIDLRLSRNMAVLGLAVMLGLLIPEYATKHKVSVGNFELDQLLHIILTTSMIVAGIVGFILDNTFPGASRAQRGFKEHVEEPARRRHAITRIDKKYSKQDELTHAEEETHSVYAFSKTVSGVLAKLPFARYVPIFPNFRKF